MEYSEPLETVLTYKIPETNVETVPYEKLPENEMPFFSNDGIKPTETKHEYKNGENTWTAYHNLGCPPFATPKKRRDCRRAIDHYRPTVADIEQIILGYTHVPKK